MLKIYTSLTMGYHLQASISLSKNKNVNIWITNLNFLNLMQAFFSVRNSLLVQYDEHLLLAGLRLHRQH